MIFIAGINDGEKKLNYRQEILCKECNRQGFLEIITYSDTCLCSLYLYSDGKEYYATTNCCNTMYKIDDEILKVEKKEISHIPDESLGGIILRKIAAGMYPDFAYCPKCGSRL